MTGEFSTYATQLSAMRNRSSVVLLQDKLYIFGGFTGTGFLSAVERGTIGANNELSSFGSDAVSRLVTGLENGVTISWWNSVSNRDEVHYIGGFNSSNPAGLDTVQRAVVEPPVFVDPGGSDGGGASIGGGFYRTQTLSGGFDMMEVVK